MTTGTAAPSPKGELSIRTLAMPADTNPSGDIFGGWLMSQMDMAAYLAGRLRARGRVVTVAVDKTELLLPVFVGDELSCYTEIAHVGRSSMAVRVEAWVRRRDGGDQVKVTEGNFTLVAVGEDRRPRPLPPDQG
ncbi:MAG: acyl-CoA thioesterase [Alphaproteobacteria bacterium]|nr:acyl-CoA thioesterase [Alphaproteobacteria bacterium]MBF0128482.1 acyl-CoA thioesterase [Alphaproteobacteria bacterium]